MKFLFITLLLLVGCDDEYRKEMEQKKAVKEKMMNEYLETLTLEQRVFMIECIDGYPGQECIERMRRLGTTPTPKQEKSGPGSMDIAIGTAVGVGATKLLFGK